MRQIKCWLWLSAQSLLPIVSRTEESGEPWNTLRCKITDNELLIQIRDSCGVRSESELYWLKRGIIPQSKSCTTFKISRFQDAVHAASAKVGCMNQCKQRNRDGRDGMAIRNNGNITPMNSISISGLIHNFFKTSTMQMVSWRNISQLLETSYSYYTTQSGFIGRTPRVRGNGLAHEIKGRRMTWGKNICGSSTTQDRSTTHPKFNLTGVQTHDFQIMTVHFMSLRCLMTRPSVFLHSLNERLMLELNKPHIIYGEDRTQLKKYLTVCGKWLLISKRFSQGSFQTYQGSEQID